MYRGLKIATAHKIARTVYYMLKHRVPFDPTSGEEFERKQRERDLASLKKKAARFGLTLVAPMSNADPNTTGSYNTIP
jgi:hypothetical protein